MQINHPPTVADLVPSMIIALALDPDLARLFEIMRAKRSDDEVDDAREALFDALGEIGIDWDHAAMIARLITLELIGEDE